MTSTDFTTFIREQAGGTTSSVLEFGAPRMHYESADSWSSLAGCMEWRAELRLSDLDGPGDGPEVTAGVVRFHTLRTGYERPREVLPLYGQRAASLTELFDDEWLDPNLDEDDDFTGGMPISVVLLVLDASVDIRLPSGSSLRAWAVAEVLHTMLPTTAGLVLMPALADAGSTKHRFVSADRIDADWPRVGCAPVPGYPRFYGQATSYVYLEQAREALAPVRDSVVPISLRD
jgi:hypothetical protein